MLSIHQSETTASVDQFWKAVDIWNKNPHTVNRRLCGALQLFCGKVPHTEVQHNILIAKIKAACGNAIDNNILQNLHEAGLDVKIVAEDDIFDEGVYFFIKKLIPRNSDKFEECYELVLFDKIQNEAVFVGLQNAERKPALTPNFLYSFSYTKEESKIHLKLKSEALADKSTVLWLKEQLFPKFLKWSETADTKTENSGLVSSSLSLINIAKYNQLYQQLKKKYGLEMVKIWPENTDPAKFVYEDVAIATYLLLLWEQERLEKGTPDDYQSFVDLGCGNGLLVHILCSEGHKGIGLDVRKRSIWDLYPATTKLEVRSIVPSAESLFPDTDWLIGNHSDELTPWIPVIAARSSYSCRFFLLPCCCFEFNGRKYQRINSSRSQYEDYMDYIYNLCKSCGFVTTCDRLRIPSTKRVCFVGSERNYPFQDMSKIDEEIKKMIDLNTNGGTKPQKEDSDQKEEINSKWSEDFIPRESVEKVRNCTQLEKSLIEEIVILVARQLLSKQEHVKIKVGENDKLWNKGGIIPLGEVASSVPAKQLKRLKSECGGLQTLLKNNGHIFFVQNGQVQLKMPSIKMGPLKKKPRYRFKPPTHDLKIQALKKQKPCWFHFSHPDGCTLLEEDCSYKH